VIVNNLILQECQADHIIFRMTVVISLINVQISIWWWLSEELAPKLCV